MSPSKKRSEGRPMTLLCAVFAAVVSTAVWYTSPSARELGVGLLCWMFWGA